MECERSMPARSFRPFLAKSEKGPVGSVDVIPEAVCLRDLADGFQRIDHARVCRPRRSDDEPRNESLLLVLLDRPLESVGPHTVPVVEIDVPCNACPQSGDAERFAHAVVHLPRHVDDRPIEIAGLESMRVSCRDDSGQIGDAPAGCNTTCGAFGIAHHVGHPAEQHVLHANRTRRSIEDPGVSVGHRREIVGGSRRENAASWDISDMSARSRIESGSVDVLAQKPQSFFNPNRLVRDGRIVNTHTFVLGRDVGG